ncbi:YigZ family protein [Flavobacteriaceae bacterium]|nr:YigZ family protein [Flavobacteriaceae bacterium]
MENTQDTYYTIASASKETLHKDRGSKFYGYAFPVTTEQDIKVCIENLKKHHHTARHFCYAWQLGESYQKYRANDDGEPNNSAGMPIYGQLQAFKLTNTLVVSVRYFGGTKLGVGGLIQAYKTSAKLTLEIATIQEKTIDILFVLFFEYSEMSSVMRNIKDEKIKLIDQKLEHNCKLTISVRKKDADRIFTLFENTHKVAIKKL